MLLVWTRLFLVCTRMLLVLYPYEHVCYSYALVWCFSHYRKILSQSEYMEMWPLIDFLSISLTAVFLLYIIFWISNKLDNTSYMGAN